MGGAGDDVLTGSKGKDRFEFSSDRSFKQKDFGEDQITDFQSAQKDSIILSQTTFNKLESVVGKGFSVIAEFDGVNGDKKAETSGAFIVYNQKTGDLFYNANGSQAGFGSGGLFATLEGAPELKESDFSLVK
jgi:Ca2+-binding RTX toxin-like protein